MKTKAEIVLQALLNQIEVTISDRTYNLTLDDNDEPVIVIKTYSYKAGLDGPHEVVWLGHDISLRAFLKLSEELDNTEAARLVFALGVTKGLEPWGTPLMTPTV